MNIHDLKTNPSNPRTITEEQFQKLKGSIKTFTKMLEVRPIAYDENNVVWGGNMRLLALKKLTEEGMEVKDSYFRKLEGYTEEDKKQFAIRDNVEFGQWDMDILANEWDSLPLNDWGVPVLKWQQELNVEEMWKQMPEMGEKLVLDGYKTVIVHFKDQPAVDAFAKLVKQKITEKTKYLWFPAKPRENVRATKIVSEK